MPEEINVPKPSISEMITSPVQQFERIKERPLMWGAMIVAAILTAISGLLLAMGGESPDLEELQGGATAGLGAVFIVTAVITSIVALLISVLVISAIHMLIAKFSLSTVSFKQLFSMNAYILIIGALGSILNGIVAALIGGGPDVLVTSMGSFIRAEGAMAGFWNSIEVFSIWSSILTAFGLQIVAGFSKKLAWIIVIVFFIIGILLSMTGSALPGMMGV
jgi:hypothetical protein